MFVQRLSSYVKRTTRGNGNLSKNNSTGKGSEIDCKMFCLKFRPKQILIAKKTYLRTKFRPLTVPSGVITTRTETIHLVTVPLFHQGGIFQLVSPGKSRILEIRHRKHIRTRVMRVKSSQFGFVSISCDNLQRQICLRVDRCRCLRRDFVQENYRTGTLLFGHFFTALLLATTATIVARIWHVNTGLH